MTEGKQLKVNSKRYKEIKNSLNSANSLEVPKEYRKEGYENYWASDEKPGRLGQLESRGWKRVVDKDGASVTISGGLSSSSPCRMHLVEIPTEQWKEIQFVKENERATQREANFEKGLGELNRNDLYQKEGYGDISSLNIKKL